MPILPTKLYFAPYNGIQMSSTALHRLTTSDATLSYRKRGHGKEVLLCFHGFGQDHTAFDHFADQLDSRYTWYSFDLFFHGDSIWKKDDEPMTKPYWKNIIEQFLIQKRIDRFSLLAYSMGARFSLCVFEAFSARVINITLVAPAGITRDPMYVLATSTVLMRFIFKGMINHGPRFFTLSKVLVSLQILNSRTARFAESQMKTKEKREQVYSSWVVFRKLEVKTSVLANLINQYKPALTIVIGKKDTVIQESKITPLLKNLNTTYRYELLDASHHQLLRKEWMSKILD